MAMAHLRNEDKIKDVKGFEQVAVLDDLQMPGFNIPWETTGRRWDVLLEGGIMREYKGAKGLGTQRLDRRFEREFLNDTFHHLFRIDSPPADFEWVIKTQGGVDQYKEKMRLMLGEAKDGDVIGSLDSRLKEALKFMRKHDEARYREAINRITELRKKLLDNKLAIVAQVN